jgi:conjugal transfer/entry exclusion protein
MRPPPLNGGPTLTSGTVVATAALIGSVIYGIWSLNQSQMLDIHDQLRELRRQSEITDDRLSRELNRREIELKLGITQINNELDRRRDQFTDIKAFVEFQARVLDELRIQRERLVQLEQTRPTTGELQATNNALRDRIDKLYSIVDPQPGPAPRANPK